MNLAGYFIECFALDITISPSSKGCRRTSRTFLGNSTERYKNDGILTNSELTSKLIKKYCQIDDASVEMLKVAAVKYQLSGRRYDRILKLSRTIADLESSEIITQNHIMQAIQYRII